MSLSWKQWLKLARKQEVVGNRSFTSRTYLQIEQLEDRIVPAVEVADLQVAVNQLRGEVQQAVMFVDEAQALGADLGIVDATLQELLDATTAVNESLNQAASANAATVTAYLRTAIPAATGGKVTIAYDNTTEAGFDPNVVRFRLKVDFVDAKTDLVPTLEAALAGIKLGTPDGLTFDLTNTLTGYFNLEVMDDGNAATAPTFMFIPGALGGEVSRIVYSPALNATLNNDGTLAGALAYNLTGSVNFDPTFTFAYGGNTAPVALPAAATPTTTAVSDPQLVARIRADLTSAESTAFKLPKFGYEQTYRLTFSDSGATSSLDPAKYYFNNALIDTTSQGSIAATVALSVLKDAGADVVGQLADVIPLDVANLLLGNFEIYDNITLSDLLALANDQGIPFDTPLDALQFFGVPGFAIDVVETVLRQRVLLDALESIDPNATGAGAQAKLTSVKKSFGSSTGSAAKFTYLGSDPNALNADILKIFKGERVDLVTYEYDITNDPAVVALDANSAFNIDRIDNGFGGTTNYLTASIHIDTDDLISKITQNVPAGIRRQAEQLLSFALQNATGGNGFSLDLDMRLSAAFRIGADTSFLLPTTTGLIAEKIQQSVYISTGNLFDFAVKGKAEIRASLPNPLGVIFDGLEDLRDQVVKEGGELGRQLGDILKNPGGFAGDLGQKFSNELAKIPGLGLTGSNFADVFASLSIDARLLFGICEPNIPVAQNDGRLTLYELLNTPNPVTDVVAAGGQINFKAEGGGSIAGVSLTLPTFGVSLKFRDIAGCTPGPDGPSLDEFNDGTPDEAIPGSGQEAKVFAEVRTVANGDKVLQVYGSSADDVITISKSLVNGFIVVEWNGRVRAFHPADFSAITIGLRDQETLTALDYAPASATAITPRDGGDDLVTILPGVPASIPVIVHAGQGNDIIKTFGQNRNVLADNFLGRVAFFGGAGDDILYGTAGDLSLLFGEEGNDTLYSGLGANILDGGADNDSLFGLPDVGTYSPTTARSVFIGGTGNDTISVGSRSRGNHVLIGGTADGTGDAGFNVIIGGYGDEQIFIGNAILVDANNVVYAPATIASGQGVAIGGPGNDTLYGGPDTDLLITGAITELNPSGNDTVFSGGGNDIVFGANLVVTLTSINASQTTDGRATIFGQDGDDFLFGGKGNDEIHGGSGEDTIDAGLGINVILGGSENDTIVIGRGIDTASGEGGDDTFTLTNPDGTIHASGGPITIDGGGQSGDLLVMSGGGAADFSETYTADGSGSGGLIVLTNGILTQSIKFSTIAAIEDTVTVGLLTVRGADAGERIEIRDGGQLGGNATEVWSDRFTPIRLNKKNRLVVNGGGGADTLLLNNPVPAVGLQTLTVKGGDGADTITVYTTDSSLNTTVIGDAGDDRIVIGNPGRSLADIRGHLVVSGGQGADDLLFDDLGTVAAQTYELSGTRLRRSSIADIAYDSIETMRLNGGAGANVYSVGSTGATTSTLIDDGVGDSRFTVQGDGLVGANTFRGNGGAEAFTLNVGTGVTGTAVTIDGGDGADNLDINARDGDDQVALRVNSTVGNGTLASLGQFVEFLTLEALNLDGQGGTNSLAWIDDTNTVFGTTLNPENGIIVRPTGASSGDVRLGLAGTLFPFITFSNVNGNFSVSGDGDGSGDRDVVSVLAASTIGLQSSWGELGTADGVDTISVSDQLVEIDNNAAGRLRSVALAGVGDQATFATLYIRAGAEPRPFGDNVTATPSNRLNILLDGMDPTSGRPGDNLKVNLTGSRSLTKSRDPNLGHEHARFVQDADGASVGFMGFEKVFDTQIAVTGTGAGAVAQVLVYDPTTGKPRFAPLTPFPGFTGGLSVASGDVNGDGIADVVVGAGLGGGPVVVVYDGIEGFEITRFFAYEDTFRSGVIVAVGDIDGDGFADIVTGTAAGGGPRVTVFSGKDQAVLANFFAYEDTFRNGVQVAVGDTNGDGFADILTGTGDGGGPRARLFDGRTFETRADFFAFDPTARGGIYVGLGDLDGDFISDMILGNGNATEPQVRAYRGMDAGLLADFYVNDPFAPNAVPEIPRESGIRVGATDIDGDDIADILVGKGPGTQPILRGYKIATKSSTDKTVMLGLSEVHRQMLFDPNVYGWGVYVGGSD